MEFQPEQYVPNLSYDSVIFGFSGEKLKVLLLEYKNLNTYALPGGFIKMDESLDKSVRRSLARRTGLDNIYLEQFYTFGSLKRFNPEFLRQILKNSGRVFKDHWLVKRFISIGYYALLDYKKVTPVPDKLSDSIGWFHCDQLPNLMMDHEEIISKALEHLRFCLERKLLSFNLLPETFTMKDLQQVYEAILGENQNRANFQRKMLSLDILERQEKFYSGGSHKAPYLYSFKKSQELSTH